MLGLHVYTQENSALPPEIFQPPKPKLFGGTGSGMNGTNGLIGGFAEFNATGNFTLLGGLGIGFWGYKITGGLRYYESYPLGIFYGISISSLTGADSSKFFLDVEGFDDPQDITIDLQPVYCVNLTMGYQFRLFRSGRIHIELGYAIPTQRHPYEIITSNTILTESGEQMFDLYMPGGVIIGAGCSFGF